MSFTTVATGAAHTGNFGASLGPGFPTFTDYGTLTQNIPTTPGGSYFITFWLANGGSPSEFGVLWDGILYWDSRSPDPFPYAKIEIGPVPASGSSTPLEFFFFNTPDFFFLDDVVVYSAGGGTTQCSQIMQPVGGYLTQTHKCDLSRFVGQDTTRCVNTDGSTAATFSPTAVNVRRVGAGWATWGSPPEAEESVPFVGFDCPNGCPTGMGAPTDGIVLTNPAAMAGVEIEPNAFGVATVTVSFRDAGGTELFSVSRDIDGFAGSRLFAASCTSASIAQMFITSPPSAAGFAVAQVRADTIVGGATERSTDVAPPVPADATSNAQ